MLIFFHSGPPDDYSIGSGAGPIKKQVIATLLTSGLLCGMSEGLSIYTDGGCSGNPGPGGWAYTVTAGDDTVITRSGHEQDTTNNRMELRAVIEALKAVRTEFAREGRFPEVVLHTDSQYVKNGITVWIHSWKANGWRTAGKKPVKNKEYWIELETLAEGLKIRWEWVPGHAGVEFNELCDSLVREEIARARTQ
jgi:ribonuclease HI